MQKAFKQEDIEKILAEADDLLKQTDPEVIKEMEEDRRLQLEQHARILKQLKSEVHDNMGKTATSEIGSESNGMHEAMDDIVKAMKALASYIS
jgi:tRNA G26 N,N-dimethylase Trm1